MITNFDGVFVNEQNTLRSFDAVVLGAGISGLVSASILLDQGHGRVVIVDEFDHVGGNHIDCTHGDYTFDVGSFIFQDDSPLLAHFPELLALYVPISPNWGKLNPKGRVTEYPFSMRHDVVSAGPVELVRLLLSFAYARIFQARISNAREFASYWIGARFLKQSGLENYLERFFGVPSDMIDVDFARKRMLWLSEHANMRMLMNRLIRRAAPRQKNRQLVRPREGFGHLYETVKRRLIARGAVFVLQARLRGLKQENGRFLLELDDRTLETDRVISTIPIDRVREVCGLPEQAKLTTVTLISLFYSFAGYRGFECSVLYNFSLDGTWKRITVFSEFYGKSGGREYFTVEVIAHPLSTSTEEADTNFRRHVAANALLVGDLVLEGSRIVPNAYPVYTERAAERAAKAVLELKAFGIESFGRQGGFDYQPTARVSTVHAEEMLQRD